MIDIYLFLPFFASLPTLLLFRVAFNQDKSQAQAELAATQLVGGIDFVFLVGLTLSYIKGHAGNWLVEKGRRKFS